MSKTNTLSTDSRKGLDTVPEKRPGHRHSTPLPDSPEASGGLKALPGRIIRFYVQGFKGMTWGRILWVLIFLKLFILFAVLRVFFFRPALAGKTTEEKIEAVGNNLSSMNITVNVRCDGQSPPEVR